MTTTKNIQSIDTLAGCLYQNAIRAMAAVERRGLSFSATDMDVALADSCRENLHMFLMIHQADLAERDWAPVRKASATPAQWEYANA